MLLFPNEIYQQILKRLSHLILEQGRTTVAMKHWTLEFEGGDLLIPNTLFVEFSNHVITVELLLGDGCQFEGGLTLISALARL